MHLGREICAFYEMCDDLMLACCFSCKKSPQKRHYNSGETNHHITMFGLVQSIVFTLLEHYSVCIYCTIHVFYCTVKQYYQQYYFTLMCNVHVHVLLLTLHITTVL